MVEVNKTKSQNSPTLKNSQKFVKWGQWFNTRSNSEKVINFEITDFSMYGDFLPKNPAIKDWIVENKKKWSANFA